MASIELEYFEQRSDIEILLVTALFQSVCKCQVYIISQKETIEMKKVDGIISNPPPAHVQVNVDFWGADIRSFRSRGLRDCYNHCRRQRGCMSFTMRKRDKYCWLKKRHNGARRMTNKRHLISANLVGRGRRTGNMNSLSRSEGKSFSKTRLYGDCFFKNIKSVRGHFLILSVIDL